MIFGLWLGLAWGLQAAVVELTEAEAAYVARGEPVLLCVDPDWEPFEWIDEDGHFRGMAADLIELVAQRTGLNIVLYPTPTWSETLRASRAGECQALSFLNQTPEREQWLIFTEPLFFDPNVIITHQEHPDIPDPSMLAGISVALPDGTMVKERIQSDYPDWHVIPTVTEAEAVELVSNRVVDITVRSLIIAAYTIRNEGLFNLKIAGRMPDYRNELRMGVLKDEPLLRDILNKGIATITDAERDAIANRHAGITVSVPTDYRIVWEVVLLAGLLLTFVLLRLRANRRIAALELSSVQQQLAAERRVREEQGRMVAMLSHEVKTPLSVINSATQSLDVLLPEANDDVGRRLERIRRGVKQLESLTRQFLEHDRVDDESLALKLVRFDLRALLDDVIADLGVGDWADVDARGIDPVVGDRELLSLAISNLLTNAMKYGGMEKPVRVVASCSKGLARVEVIDQGPGVPKAIHAQLFDRYVRARDHQGIPGAGLGLYIVERVAKRHGGRVWLEDTSAGAHFVLEWPSESGG